MENNNFLVVLIALAVVLFMLLVPAIPFTAPQFYSQATDLNYSSVLNGDKNNQVLIIKGTTISTADANDLNVALPDLSGFVPYQGATADVNLGSHDLEVSNIVASGEVCAGNTCTDSLFYGDFGNVNPVSTFSGGVRGSSISTNSGYNSAGGYFTNSSTAYTSGSNSLFGVYAATTDSHVTGTSYQNNGIGISSIFQPNSGTPSAARQYGGTLSSYVRATGSANPTATTVLGLLLQAGQYPTADVGTIGNAQGIQININTGDTDNSGGGLKITTARGILVNEPVNYGEIQNWHGLEMSNAYYNFGGNIVNDYSNIFLKGLNGGTVGGSSYNIYMEEMGRGEDGNWQIYSVGGNSYFGDGNIYLDGYMHADDYITNSKVADVDDGVSALSKLDNAGKWKDSKGEINYGEHYAGVSYPISKVTGYETKLVEEVSCTPILDKDKKEQFNDLGARIEDCKTVKVSKQVPVTKVVVEEGLSMETRVAEMEKMIYELKTWNKELEWKLCTKDLVCVLKVGIEEVVNSLK